MSVEVVTQTGVVLDDVNSYRCPSCCKALGTQSELDHHILMNHKRDVKRPHVCSECGMAFHKPRELTRHQRYKHTYEKPYMCPECDYTSVELSNVKRHMKRHAGDRPHQCPDCGYATLESSKLRRHMKIHEGSTLLECDVCHACFASNCALKGHQRMHQGSSPSYTCYQCPTSCLRKVDLLIHIRQCHSDVHIDERSDQMTCRLCNTEFSDFYTFTTHMKSHQKDGAKCDLCPFTTKYKHNLKVHRELHTHDQLFNCPICGKSCKNKEIYSDHMVMHNLQHAALLQLQGNGRKSLHSILLNLQLRKAASELLAADKVSNNGVAGAVPDITTSQSEGEDSLNTSNIQSSPDWEIPEDFD